MTFTVLSNNEDVIKLKLSQGMTFAEVNGHVDPLVQVLGDTVYGHRVHVDMSGSESIDSSGVGWLVATHKKFKTAGGHLVLHSYQPQVQKVFSVLQMEHVLNLCQNENEIC